MSVVRMRTVKATSEYFKHMDPESPINEYFIRRLVKQGRIPVVYAGNKVLINLDKLIDYLNSDTTDQQEDSIQEYGILRKVME